MYNHNWHNFSLQLLNAYLFICTLRRRALDVQKGDDVLQIKSSSRVRHNQCISTFIFLFLLQYIL